MSEGVQTTIDSFPSDSEADSDQPEQNMSEGVQTRGLVEEGTPEPANDESQPDPVKTDKEAKLELVRLRFNEAGADYKSKNYRRAFNQFLEIATKDDFPQAQFNLAVMLKLGQGTLQDYAQAYKWCALAGLNGFKKAEKYLERLKDLLTEKRHEEIQQEVAKLLEKNIYSGSKKHIIQLSRWLTRKLFDNKKNRDLALIWALVGSALDLDGATEIREMLAEDLEIDELERIQSKAKEIFTDPKFQKLYGAL
jgi:TPR repeat protein